MTEHKDQAVCIRKINYSESSQILTLFGRLHGKIRAIAKGARKPRSKFSGGFDLLTAGAVRFLPTRGENSLCILVEFVLQEGFAPLRKNLLALHAALYAADLLTECTEDLDPHPDLFDAFFLALRTLPAAPHPLAVLLPFEITLLDEIGLGPDWKRCAACGKSLPSRKKLYFSSRTPGMICPDCEPAVIEKRFLSPAALALLQNPGSLASAAVPLLLEVHTLLAWHQRELLGKQTPAMTFFDKLLQK